MESEVRIELLDQGSTTLIMRGLNRQVTHTSILPLLDGFPPHIGRRVFDFVYVPWATNAATNIGLAFVNFESHQFCKTFLDSLHKPSSRKKLLSYGIRSVGQALIQGRGANLKAILAKRGQAGLDETDAPLVFHRGEPTSLEGVVHREAREALGSGIEVGNTSMMTIAPPTPEQTPIPRIVTRACGAQSSHRRETQQLQGTGHDLVPAAQPPLISSGCSAFGCYGNQHMVQDSALSASPPFEPWNCACRTPVALPAGSLPLTLEWQHAAYLQPAPLQTVPPVQPPVHPMQPMQPIQNSYASLMQSGSSHAVHLQPRSMMHSQGNFDAAGMNIAQAGFCPSSTTASTLGQQSFNAAGCVPGSSNLQQFSQACEMNAFSVAPAVDRPTGAGNWWSIPQTAQLQDTAANAPPRVQRSLPHAASRMTWDL